MKLDLLLFCVTVSMASFGQAALVKDINTQPKSSSIGAHAQLGDKAYFVINERLWRSDGTPGGTELVSGLEDVRINGEIVSFNGSVYFNGIDFLNGGELWKTDGTSGGTGIVKDITPGETNTSISLSKSICGGKLFFRVNASLSQLWETDGSENGTRILKEFPYMELKECACLNDILYFNAEPDFFEPSKVWRTDGTELGTVVFNDAYSARFFVLGNSLLYVENGQLWKSDGINPLSSPITSPGPFDFQIPSTSKLVEFNGAVYFTAQDDNHGAEVWKYEEAGEILQLLAEIAPGASSAQPFGLKVVGPALYFAADDNVHGIELWKTDGTNGGTELVADINPGVEGSIKRRRDANGDVDVDIVEEIGPNMILVANDGLHGEEVWRTDGVEVGTTLLKDIKQGVKGAISEFDFVRAKIGEQLLFFANDGLVGNELWSTTGTGSETNLVVDISPGSENSNAASLRKVLNKLVFFSDDGGGFDLWTSDGTGDGTNIIKEFDHISNFVGGSVSVLSEFKSKLIFNIPIADVGREFWVSDLTESGTTLLVDLWTGPAGGMTSPSYLVVNDLIFFRGNDDSGLGHELFVSDGTAEGTQLVLDIHTGAGSSRPLGFFSIDGFAYTLAADDGTSRDLWKTDGTEIGTKKVYDFQGKLIGGVGEHIEFNSKAIFNLEHPDFGFELWFTDGTESGTGILQDIYPGHGSSNPADFVRLGDYVFFSALEPSAGRELWITDGTPSGTRQFIEIMPGQTSAVYPFAMAAKVNDRIFFSADNGINGYELWVTDGTIENTEIFADLFPGAEGSIPHTLTAISDNLFFSGIHDGVRKAWYWNSMMSEPKVLGGINPSEFTLVGNTLIFLADDPATGRELWKYEFEPGELVNIHPEPDPEPTPIPDPVTALTKDFKKQVNVYPNPVHDVLFVENGRNATLIVRDMLGREVFLTQVKDEQSIEVGALPPGLYILEISTIEGRSQFRFVKEN